MNLVKKQNGGKTKMKWKYKSLMFLILLIFCIGSVCATEPNNTTNTNLTDDQKVVNIVNKALEKKNVEIKALQDNDIKQSMEIQQLKENNTQLDKRVKALEDSKLTQSNRIKSLEIDIKNLEDSNKALNVKINNQNSIINELNNKLELQLIEIKGLQADKDKLNAEKCSIYEKLLESPKKEDYEQLKKDIADKDNKIKELNTKIKILNNILNINKKDVINSLKALSSTNIQNIKCGKYTFKLEDYLKIPLIKEGKKNILKFKKDNGRLPNYVIIGDYKVPQNVYKKLYNL